ncbi:unnamed protein product [Heterobilharzia americana]|nr:unnamed protein product [Heterobilharzia americana]
MSGSRRGLVAPQNTFLDKIIRRCNGQFYSFVLANARIVDYPIVYCNEGFSRLTGYSRVDIMQKSGSCAFFYGDQTTKEMRERLLKALDTQTPDQIEMLFYKKNRLPFWLLVCVAPVRNECEEVVLFLLAFRDITALKTPFEDEDTVKGDFGKCSDFNTVSAYRMFEHHIKHNSQYSFLHHKYILSSSFNHIQ